MIRALLASALLASCGPFGAPPPETTPPVTETVEKALAAPTASSDAIRPPLGDPAASPDDGSCQSEQELRDRLESFTQAMNTGSVPEIERSLSPVLWVIAAGGATEQHWAVYGKAEAARELIRRHAAGERWKLVEIFQPTLRGWDGASHFGVRMERTRGGVVVAHLGKGALFCRGRYEGIEVLSLGSE